MIVDAGVYRIQVFGKPPFGFKFSITNWTGKGFRRCQKRPLEIMEEFIWSHVESEMIVEVCLGAMYVKIY